MGVYRIRVSTGSSLFAGSTNQVQLWLVGQHGEATLRERFRPLLGKETEFKEDVTGSLGPLLFVKMRKKQLLQDDAWFCNWISVQGPGAGGEEFWFPCYRWVEGSGILSLPEGTGERRVGPHVGRGPSRPVQEHREEELEERRKLYRWGNWKDGLILNVAAANLDDLPQDERFLEDKKIDFETSLAKGLTFKCFTYPYLKVGQISCQRLCKCSSRWNDLDDFNRIFWYDHSSWLVKKVRDSWKEDAFFGYQFLNGANPMLLRRSSRLPARLVFPSGMEEVQAQLEQELKLQLPRTGSPPPPLFLPTDPPMAWLLAKCWVRSSDFQLHELLSHLLRAHFMAEVIAMATMRCLPSIHPVFKLIMPHLQYTLEVNVRARTGLVSEHGIFDQVVSTGGGGHVELLRRARAFLTYRSFCPPDDLTDRGLLGVKSSYYAQDALRLWEIMYRYVEGIVSLHFKMDKAVKEDLELQTWCREITEIGLLGAQDQGFPMSLESRDQLCHFVTMCIFTCTGQHASVHLGQLDWYSWVPNAPCTMRLPPPTTKDATLETVMATLPNFHQASLQMSMTWQLGRRQPISVLLGQHEEEYFSGPEPKAALKKFREELAALDKEIEIRNAKLYMPYEYLRPSRVENSVAI
ncbi:hypothetical protein QTO34_009535 [Cnephaeus nilssonii]|uniref:Arachidonate 15-lipoxygenase n=1 Tax=Cnephaeus nilssonii TaxID=3371016 RepID=A0AA40HHZ7_CNENI|nr:hypothetical protein QTO34_009535 [Eptesicus nilssonii]